MSAIASSAANRHELYVILKQAETKYAQTKTTIRSHEQMLRQYEMKIEIDTHRLQKMTERDYDDNAIAKVRARIDDYIGRYLCTQEQISRATEEKDKIYRNIEQLRATISTAISPLYSSVSSTSSNLSHVSFIATPFESDNKYAEYPRLPTFEETIAQERIEMERSCLEMERSRLIEATKQLACLKLEMEQKIRQEIEVNERHITSAPT